MPLDGTGLDPVVQTLLGAENIIVRRVDPVVQTLLGAENIIVRRGWRKGALGVNGGPRCVVGAIQESAETVAVVWGLDRFKLRWSAGYVYGTTVGTAQIEAWQDSRERTIEDIRDGFSRSIARAIYQRAAV